MEAPQPPSKDPVTEPQPWNVVATVMDGHALTLPDASFDAVVSMFGWFMFSDRARALAEIHRVLRPGRVLGTMERAGAPFVVLRNKLGDDQFKEALRKSRDYLATKLGSGRVTLQAEAIYTSATR